MDTDEKKYIKECFLQLTKKYNFKKIKEWKASDIKTLSHDVYTKTGVLISERTFKRIFDSLSDGKNYKPQPETRNSIARYLGYNDWLDFKKKSETTNLTQNNAPKSEKTKKTDKKNILFYIIILFIITSLGIFVLVKQNYIPDYSLTVDSTEFEYPLTININYDFSNFQTNKLNLIIKKEFDKSYGENIYVTNDKGILKFNILLPGKYNITASTLNNQFHKSSFYSYSNAWLKTVKHKKASSFYTLPCKPKNGIISTTFKDLHSDKVDTSLYSFHSVFENFSNYPVSLDSMIFITRVKGHDSPWPVTKFFKLILVGDKKNHSAYIHDTFYKSHAIKTSEKKYIGENHDLKEITTNFSEWRVVKIESFDHKFKLFIDDQLKFEGNYSEEVGNLKGILFYMHAFGYIDYVHIFNEKKDSLYIENFD